jgi:hypothetical protein
MRFSIIATRSGDGRDSIERESKRWQINKITPLQADSERGCNPESEE